MPSYENIALGAGGGIYPYLQFLAWILTSVIPSQHFYSSYQLLNQESRFKLIRKIFSGYYLRLSICSQLVQLYQKARGSHSISPPQYKKGSVLWLVATGRLLMIMRKNILRTIPSCGGGKPKTWDTYHGISGIAVLLDFFQREKKVLIIIIFSVINVLFLFLFAISLKQFDYMGCYWTSLHNTLQKSNKLGFGEDFWKQMNNACKNFILKYISQTSLSKKKKSPYYFRQFEPEFSY